MLVFVPRPHASTQYFSNNPPVARQRFAEVYVPVRNVVAQTHCEEASLHVGLVAARATGGLAALIQEVRCIQKRRTDRKHVAVHVCVGPCVGILFDSPLVHALEDWHVFLPHAYLFVEAHINKFDSGALCRPHRPRVLFNHVTHFCITDTLVSSRPPTCREHDVPTLRSSLYVVEAIDRRWRRHRRFFRGEAIFRRGVCNCVDGSDRGIQIGGFADNILLRCNRFNQW